VSLNAITNLTILNQKWAVCYPISEPLNNNKYMQKRLKNVITIQYFEFWVNFIPSAEFQKGIYVSALDQITIDLL
jgi:hypothetical protein